MPVWIAELAVTFVWRDGTRGAGRIAVGTPEPHPHGFACAVAIDGLDRQIEIFGVDAMQALLLALRSIGHRLHDVLSRGGRVVDEDDEDVPLDAIFGPLICEPKPPEDP